MSHPDDTCAVHIEDLRPDDQRRLTDAITETDDGASIELLPPSEHDGVVLVGPEAAFGRLYLTLGKHADDWAAEHEGREADQTERLQNKIYDGISNARAAVALARLQSGHERAGDRDAVRNTYHIQPKTP